MRFNHSWKRYFQFISAGLALEYIIIETNSDSCCSSSSSNKVTTPFTCPPCSVLTSSPISYALQDEAIRCLARAEATDIRAELSAEKKSSSSSSSSSEEEEGKKPGNRMGIFGEICGIFCNYLPAAYCLLSSYSSSCTVVVVFLSSSALVIFSKILWFFIGFDQTCGLFTWKPKEVTQEESGEEATEVLPRVSVFLVSDLSKQLHNLILFLGKIVLIQPAIRPASSHPSRTSPPSPLLVVQMMKRPSRSRPRPRSC